MATFNTRFFGVTRTAPLEGSGWKVRVLDYRDFSTVVCHLIDYTSLSVGPELNASGNGSITVDLNSGFWNRTMLNGLPTRHLLEREYVFECVEDGVARFAFLGSAIEESQVAEDGGKECTISGPGIADVMKWALVMRPGWPKVPPIAGKTKEGDTYRRPVSSSDALPAVNWQFPLKWPTMRMWMTTLDAAKRRGGIPWVKPSFTHTRDSDGRLFEYVPTLGTVADKEGFTVQDPTQGMLDWLNDCTGQDTSSWFGERLEWFMRPGFKLDVRKRFGVNRAKTVVFYEPQLESKNRTRDRSAIFNVITTINEEDEGDDSTVSDAGSISMWNRREQRQNAAEHMNGALRYQVSLRNLEQRKDEKSEWTVSIPYYTPGRRPFRNFAVGDVIGLMRFLPSGTYEREEYRVLAIVVTVSGDEAEPTVELTLQSKIDSRLKELEKDITRLLNKPTAATIAAYKKAKDAANAANSAYNAASNVIISTTDPALKGPVAAGTFWLEVYDDV